MNKAVVFLANGAEECEALITVDILRRASIETVMASVSSELDIISSHGIKISADAFASDIDFDEVSAIILPGGVKGVENLSASDVVKTQCLAFAAEGKLLAAICAAPSILDALGIITGKTATANPGFEARCSSAKLTHTRTARDGNIITGQAVGGTFEFALEIVAALSGYETANAVRRSICL